MGSSALYHKRIKDGFCGLCGIHPLFSKACCEACLDQGRQRSNQKRIERIEAGICVECGCELQTTVYQVCDDCRAKRQEWNKAYRKRSGYARKYYDKNRAKRLHDESVRGKRLRAEWRKQALDHYGWMCQCCGETLEEFLTIDHVDGDGNKHRQELRGKPITKWLKENNYPEGFQTLCMNCNWSRGIWGYCPHQKQQLHSVSTKAA